MSTRFSWLASSLVAASTLLASGAAFADLLGSSCEQNEFQLALSEVLETSDRYDDLIVQRWGGRRTTDKLFDDLN